MRYAENLDASVILPCLNEEACVGECVDGAKAFLARQGLRGEVLVVDNGSTDDSANAARAHGARVIFAKRKGYGNALRAGLAASRGRILLMGDCDLTYDFRDLAALYAPLAEGSYDMMVGDRFAGKMEKGAMPVSHWLGVRFLSAVGRRQTGTNVRDFHCGLRGITKSAAKTLLFRTSGMEFASEMIALAAKNGLRIGETPVHLRKCPHRRKSKLRALPDGLRHLQYLLRVTV